MFHLSNKTQRKAETCRAIKERRFPNGRTKNDGDYKSPLLDFHSSCPNSVWERTRPGESVRLGLVFATLLRLASTHVPQTSRYFSSPRIFRRFLAESKISTAQWRACFDNRGQSARTSFA